jgi:NDP-4-keto-2,6-dideoxyhexose 3-C-methyltransferase
MIALMGASTKGNTLLQYFGLDDYYIEHAAEVNEDKFGLKTVGTNIRIISQKDSFFLAPDYYFIPIWHFASFLINKHTEYLEKGGKFIIPMPKPVIVYMNDKGEIEWQVMEQSLPAAMMDTAAI